MSFLTGLCKHLCVAIDPDKYPNMYIKERKTFNKLHRTIPMEWQIDSWSDCDVNGFNTFSTQHESKSAKNNRAIESKISATLKCADKVTHLYKETNTITYKYIPAPASKYGIVCMKNEQINQEKKIYIFISKMHVSTMNTCQKNQPFLFISVGVLFKLQINNKQQINASHSNDLHLPFCIADFIAWRQHTEFINNLTTYLISMKNSLDLDRNLPKIASFGECWAKMPVWYIVHKNAWDDLIWLTHT